MNANSILIICAIIGALAILLGIPWKLATILARLEGKIDLQSQHIVDHCGELEALRENQAKIMLDKGLKPIPRRDLEENPEPEPLAGT